VKPTNHRSAAATEASIANAERRAVSVLSQRDPSPRRGAGGVPVNQPQNPDSKREDGAAYRNQSVKPLAFESCRKKGGAFQFHGGVFCGYGHEDDGRHDRGGAK
jgi:hypothetical protein